MSLKVIYLIGVLLIAIAAAMADSIATGILIMGIACVGYALGVAIANDMV